MSFTDLESLPDRLQIEIEQGRLHNQWPSVLKLMEKITYICDIGAVQLNVDAKLRTYYWTVMAEIVMEHRHDYTEVLFYYSFSNVSD